MPDSTPLSNCPGGLRLAVRLQPGASRAQVDGLATLDDGAVVLKARVSEAPEGGKANAALLKLLAKTWGLPKSSLSLVAGHKDRRKVLAIAGDPTVLQPILAAWLKALPRQG